MSNFTRPTSYEFRLNRPLGGVDNGLVLIARFDVGYSGVGSFVRFDAERRGMLLGENVPQELHGSEWRRREASGPTYYANQLRDRKQNWHLAILIDGIARQELTGKTAGDVVWTLFWRLVIQKRGGREWIHELDNEWLTGLVEESQRPVSQEANR